MTSVRVTRLAAAIGAARSWSATPNGTKFVVRVEGPEGKQEAWLSAAEHAELLAFLDRGPGSLEDHILGTLVYSAERQSWECVRERVRLSFASEKEDSMAASLAHGRRLYAALRQVTERAASHAASTLLATKNRTWLQKGEPPKTHEAFVAALELQSVVVKPDGAAELCFSDGDLFWGHSVQVVLDASGEATLATLVG